MTYRHLAMYGAAQTMLRTLSLLVLLLHAPFLAAQEASDAPLVSGYVNVPVFGFEDANGETTGFLVELSRMLGAELGLPIEFREAANSAEFVQAQIAGRSDIIAGIGDLPGLRATNALSDPVATETLHPVVLTENAEQFEGVEISGARVGIVPPALGSDETEFLARNVPVSFDVPEAAMAALWLGNIDVVLLPSSVVFSISRQANLDGRISFVGTPMRRVTRHVAVHDSRMALMPQINAAIDRMRADGRLVALQRRFGLNVPAPPPDVLVVGVTDFPPYQFFDEAGVPSGFAVEVLRDLASLIGRELAFRPIERSDWIDGPSPGVFDVLPSTSINAERADLMDFTLPIQRSVNNIYVRPDFAGLISGPDDLSRYKVGVQVNSQAARLIAQKGVDEVTVFDDRDDMITSLRTGQIDAVVFNARVFDRLLITRDLDNEIVSTDQPFNIVERAPALRFGLGEVRDQLNAVIPGYILSPEYNALEQKYFGERTYWTRARIFMALAALLLALGMGFLTYMRSVRRARQAAAMSLRIARDELETIFDAATSGIIALDQDSRIVRINSHARHMLGGTAAPTPFSWPADIQFLNPDTLKPLDANENPLRRAISGHALRGATYLMRRSGPGADHRYVRLDNAPIENADSKIFMVLIIDDVSNEERNRQVVERKGRLDALGQLTGGIAHDFNNVLASQLYAVDLARKSDDPERRDQYLTVAADSIERGRSLTSRLLSFARRQPGLRESRLTAEVFAEFEELIRPMLEAQIGLTVSVDDPGLQHYCDQTQLETALMNLVLNARDAILRAGTGNRIELRARAVSAPKRSEANIPSLSDPLSEPGTAYRFVEISVSDNGPGMDRDTLDRCTDPFFTTKDSNSGTGLGLAMVYGFAHQSDGDLHIYSEPGVGTTMQLVLPRGTVDGPREAPQPPPKVSRGAGQTILVVEDEHVLIEMLTDVLAELNYRVAVAHSGQEALMLVEDGLSFDVLMTDVVMPGKIGGFELAKRVRERHPDMPVIYLSGYTGFTASEMGAVPARLLQKPASPREVAQAVLDALNGTSGPVSEEVT